MTITINGSGTITGATTMASATSFSSTASFAGDVTLAGSGVELLNNSGRVVVGQTGSVIQVVQTVKTDTFSVAGSATWVDITGLSVAITPTSTSSKILVISSFGGQGSLSTGSTARITRAGTAIDIATGTSNRIPGSFSEIYNSRGDSFNMFSTVFLDSPATASSVTYAVQVYAPTGTIYINRSATDTDNSSYSRGVSSITVLEIAQ